MEEQVVPTVVLIDDSDDIRLLLRMVLERRGEFRVLADAATAHAGIGAVAEHQPDLVLLDVSMPDMDGMEAIGPVREASPNSLIVMLSGYAGGSGFEQRSRHSGADGYVQKGGPPSWLLEELRQLLAARRDDHSD